MPTLNTADESSSMESKKPGNCNNRTGKNQYKDRPAPDDPRVSELLKEYHCKGITDRTQVSKLLLQEHGIILSESSISRRKRKLGLKASHCTTMELNVTVKRQLILDQMTKDPKGRLGARMVKQGILRDTGIHLTRDYIREEMRNLDPTGYAARGPAHVKAKRQQKQFAAQDSSVEPSEGQDNLGSLHSAQLDISSGSIHSPRATSLSPAHYSTAMDLDEVSGCSSAGPHLETARVEVADLLDPPLSHNAHPGPHSDSRSLPDTLPPTGPSRAVILPSMTVALDILRDLAPQMGALTRILDTIKADEEVLDMQAHSLVAGGMEVAALLERQLARVASKAQRYQP